MSDLLSITVEGLPALLNKIKGMAAHIRQEVDGELSFAAEEIRNEAIDAAAIDKGRLKQGISVSKFSEMNYEVASNALYSPYIEFGTGDLVNVPEELTDYALQFKGRGIRKINLPARPFFFPGFFIMRPKILDNIKKILTNP